MKYEGKKWGSLTKLEQEELWGIMAHCEETYEKNGSIDCVIYFENNFKVDGYITQYSKLCNPPGINIKLEIDDDAIITSY